MGFLKFVLGCRSLKPVLKICSVSFNESSSKMSILVWVRGEGGGARAGGGVDMAVAKPTTLLEITFLDMLLQHTILIRCLIILVMLE